MPICLVHRKEQKEWKLQERRSERRFLNRDLEAGIEQISKKKFRNPWISPSDGNAWWKDYPKAYRK